MTCIVTGANVGLGLATCKALAAKGWRVIMVGRSEEKLYQARKEILSRFSSGQLTIELADFSSLRSVHDLAQRLNHEYNEIQVLVNNAGAFFTEYQATEDGFERQWQINHLSPFLLTHLLLDKLQKSTPARIVNVSSNAHYKGAIKFDDLNQQQNYSGYYAYAQSKLANVLFTYELAQRFPPDQVTANCLHPGVVDTGIGDKNSKGWMHWGWRALRPFIISPEKGAATQVFLAASPEVAQVTGAFFSNCRKKRSSSISHDQALAKQLWQVSLAQTGLGNS